MKTAEFEYLLLKLLNLLYKHAVHHLHFLAKEKHPFCAQYSLISDASDVKLMMLRWPKFVQILIDQNKINRSIFSTINR